MLVLVHRQLNIDLPVLYMTEYNREINVNFTDSKNEWNKTQRGNETYKCQSHYQI